MAREEMRADRRRIIRGFIALAAVMALAVLVPIAGHASHAIGFLLGAQ